VFKRLDPSDIHITPFKVYKEFTVTNVDSASGVYNFRAVSGSTKNFNLEGQNVTTYPSASFYHLSSWFLINNMYYMQKNGNTKLSFEETNPIDNFGSNSNKQYRFLHTSASIVSIPQKLFGERIKPKSIELTDDSTDITVTLVDDGDGNLYDQAYSASYAIFKSGSLENGIFDHTKLTETTGSVVGNVFYDHGVVVVTDTGSRYIDVGQKRVSDGYSLKYKAQETITEYNYMCVVGENEFNSTLNKSVTLDKSGSISVSGSESWKLFPPGDALYKSGSYKHSYNAATDYEGFVSHSEFRPYVTRVGLYNDFNQLIAVGSLSAPVKNDKDLSLSIVVRFDA